MTHTMDFLEKYLPNKLIHERDHISYNLHQDDQILEDDVKGLWTRYYSELGILPPFELLFTVRRNRNRYNNNLEKMILIKIHPNEENVEPFVASVIYVNEKNIVRYFILHKLEPKILPVTYVKRNQVHVILESDKSNNLKNWGKIINPHNLSDIVTSVSFINH